MNKKIPFTLSEITELKIQHPTPFYIYDEEGIRKTIQEVYEAFSWNKGFKEHFAVKALPNPSIISLLKEYGAGCDAASLPEIEIAKMAGVNNKDIIFTSNQTTIEEYKTALKEEVLINLDAIEQIDNLMAAGMLPDTLCLRYNPGEFIFSNSLIGELKQSKFGMRKDQLFTAIHLLKDKGVCHFGIHSMLAGNILDVDYYPTLAEMLFQLCIEIKEKLDVSIEFLDFAGGVGIPYKPDEKKVDIHTVGKKVKELYDLYHMNCAIKCEMGRYITGPHGYLVTEVTCIKESYKKYVGVDGSSANLLRPAMYGSYHEIINLSSNEEKELVDVVGPLCENNDKFAIDRLISKAHKGDILIIADAGAHSHSMGYQYNGRLRSAEFLYCNHEFKMIRRKETVEDYLATLNI